MDDCNGWLNFDCWYFHSMRILQHNINRLEIIWRSKCKAIHFFSASFSKFLPWFLQAKSGNGPINSRRVDRRGREIKDPFSMPGFWRIDWSFLGIYSVPVVQQHVTWPLNMNRTALHTLLLRQIYRNAGRIAFLSENSVVVDREYQQVLIQTDGWNWIWLSLLNCLHRCLSNYRRGILALWNQIWKPLMMSGL